MFYVSLKQLKTLFVYLRLKDTPLRATPEQINTLVEIAVSRASFSFKKNPRENVNHNMRSRLLESVGKLACVGKKNCILVINYFCVLKEYS